MKFFAFLKIPKKAYLALPFFFLSLFANAQDCSCVDAYDEMVAAFEENYSLFHIKVNEGNRNVYLAFKELLRDDAKTTGNFEDCKIVLGHWLGFFRDGHIWNIYKPSEGGSYETYALDEDKFKEQYQSSDMGKDDVIGIWKSGKYTVAVIPEQDPLVKGRDYLGVILESELESWKKEEVKFHLKKVYGNDYTATFFMGDHNPKNLEARMKSSSKLSFKDLNDWVKIWPAQDQERTIPATTTNGFEFKMLEGNIPYFKFPDFDDSSKAIVDSIISENHEKLVNAEFMVIDVRQNAGGSDYVYYNLMPYILTEPIEMPQVYHYLSAYNKTQLGVDVEEEDIDKLEAEEDRKVYRLFYNNQDTLINFYEGQHYIYQPDTFYSNPKRIAILTTGAASSGETFILRSMKSPRVTLYGQNTKGVIDGFNGAELELSCFTIRYPLSVRAFDVDVNPIDPYGIAPDVYLDDSVDALEFALKHIKYLK